MVMCVQGFHRVKDNLEDICLDNPQGGEQLQDICSQGVKEGWLESDWDSQQVSVLSNAPPSSPRSMQVPAMLLP